MESLNLRFRHAENVETRGTLPGFEESSYSETLCGQSDGTTQSVGTTGQKRHSDSRAAQQQQHNYQLNSGNMENLILTDISLFLIQTILVAFS